MKILIKIVCVFLYFNYVSPVLMYYIYDDNPTSGYVAVSTVQPDSNPKHNFAGIHKKQFNIYKSGYHKSSSQILDTHFKIKKTADQSYVLSSVETKKTKEPQGITDSPLQKTGKEVTDTMNILNNGKSAPSQTERRNVAVAAGRDTLKQMPKTRTYGLPLNIDTYNAQSNQRNYPLNQLTSNDDSPKSVEVNVRKILIPSVPHKIKLSNNRHLTSVSIHRLANHQHQKMPPAGVADKTLQKTSNFVDPKFQVMSRFLEDITQKDLGERVIRIDSSNRKSKRKVASDNIKKYIGKNITDPSKQVLSLLKNEIVDNLIMDTRPEKSNDLSTHQTVAGDMNQYTFVGNENNNYDAVRIQSQEEEELSDTPNALFYRMNIETLEGESGFVPLNSNQDNTNFMYSTNNKRSKKNAARKKNSNSVRLHKNYRKF